MEKKMDKMEIEIRRNADVEFTAERKEINLEKLRALLTREDMADETLTAMQAMMDIERLIWKAVGKKGDVKDPDGKAVTPLTHEIRWEFVENTHLVPYIQPKKRNELL